MAMRPSSRRELYKLRELVHFLLVGKTCPFCLEPLSPTAEEWDKHGDAVGPVFQDSLTVHHVDGNHGNNEHSNKVLCHTKCHKSYHRRLENQKRSEARKGE